MFDPITVFSFMLLLGSSDLPSQRLSVQELIRHRETIVVVETISKDVQLRPGL
jgi:hypothetical protein